MGFFTTKNSFLRAVRRGDVATVQQLLATKDKDVFLKATDERGYSAVQMAAIEGEATVLEALLEAGAPVDAKTHNGETALHLAAGNYTRSDSTLKILLAKGAAIEEIDNGGRTALGIAAANHLGESYVRILLEGGATPDARALLAAADRSEESMLALMEKGAKPDAADMYGRTALHVAASRNWHRAVEAMLDKGADINARDSYYGYTPLLWAISNGHSLMVEKLLDRGARTDLKNNQGKAAVDFAYERQNAVITQMIEQRTAPPPVAPALKDSGEQWLKLGEERVAYVGTFPAIGRRLTEIFNFAARERVSISENLKTGQETSGAPESFDTISEAALQKAMEAYRTLGGKPDAGHVFGSRLNKLKA